MLTVLLAAHSYNKGAANNLTTTTHPHKKHAWQQAQGGPASRPHQKISTFFWELRMRRCQQKYQNKKTPTGEQKSERGPKRELPPPEKQRIRRLERTRYK